ncbi:ribonuclease Z [Malassezia sp. CBS 17886]|nr:ribonuclease Z [Malassezia sp. CBS 17886]
MSETQAEQRQLAIKTGVVKRLTKELAVYAQETDAQAAKTQQYIADGRDAYDIKKQMVPDTRRRLADATSDLDVYLHGASDAAKHTPEHVAAVAALAAAQPRAAGARLSMAPPPVSVKFLGTGTTPVPSRNYSSLLVRIGQHAVMVDCGEGTQRQLLSSHIRAESRLSQIHLVLITHLHPDHTLGLVPMMLSMMGPSAPSATTSPRLVIIGPLGLRALVRTTLALCYASLGNEFVVHEMLWPGQPEYPHDAPGQAPLVYEESGDYLPAHVRGQRRVLPVMPPHENELLGRNIRMDVSSGTWADIASVADTGVTISAAPITHRCPTVGYVFQEAANSSQGVSPRDLAVLDSNTEALFHQHGISRPRTLLPRLLRDREPLRLPDGSVLHPPPRDRPGRKLCILGDTSDASGGLRDMAEPGAPHPGMLTLARDADLLVHECTYAAMDGAAMQAARAVSADHAALLARSLLREDEAEPRALSRGHSVPRIVGEFAGELAARHVVVNHFSARIPAPRVTTHAPLESVTQLSAAAPSRAESVRWFHVLKEIERQVTVSWHDTLRRNADSHPDTCVRGSERPCDTRAIAAYDGLTVSIPPRAPAHDT